MKYFVITPGRTGSSLLCSILADAGASFGATPPDDWHRKNGGAMESEFIRDAVARYVRAGQKPAGFVARRKWRRRRSEAISLLCKAMETADFLKCVNLDLLVPEAEKMGHECRIILSVRDYSGFTFSIARMKGANGHGLKYTLPLYKRTLHDGVMLLERHGGCVVDYNDLISGTDWIPGVARITGLDAEKLADAHERRVSFKNPDDPLPLCAEADTLYRTVREAQSSAGWP